MTATPSSASVYKQEALVAKLRHMGKQYAAGKVARGGAPRKHYLEEAADEIEMMAWTLSMNKVTPASAQENAALRKVIQAACIDGPPGLASAWEKYFPDHPITIKAAEVERLAAQAAPSEPQIDSRFPAAHYGHDLQPSQAPVVQAVQPTQAVRMLTEAEQTAIIDMHNTGRAQGDHECAEAIQRKFCEVNGLPIPADGVIGGAA